MAEKRANISPTRIIPVVESTAADLLTPLAVYLSLSRGSEFSFLFESVEGGESLARYSFIGSNPAVVLSGGHEAFIEVREHLKSCVFGSVQDLPPFIGGAVGYLGFEACEWFEPALESQGSEGICEFMMFRSIAAFDHVKQIIRLVSLAFVEDGADEQEAIAAAARCNVEMRDQIARTAATPGQAVGVSAGYESGWERSGFEQCVVKVKGHIAAGDCYQTVLSQRFTRPTPASAVSIYRALRSINPSPYMFLMRFGPRSVIGASPEMLVRCSSGNLEYRPIAGTRKRSGDRIEDARLAAEMASDEKEVAEHMMLVDLGRNDLGRVCEYGSVSVDALMRVEKYSHVQHLVSSLSGRLRDGLDSFDALAACFPAGTVSGAPKVRAIEILRELEPTSRGVYAGAVGYFDYAGNMDTCIAIRTIVLADGVATLQAGAGVVADSVPELEYEETINKAAVLLRAIEVAEEGRP